MDKEEFNNNEVTVKVSGDLYFYSMMYSVLNFVYAVWVIMILILWFVGGILAFLASIGCMFYNSSVGDKVAGFLLALIFGPFYWFFYIYKSTYCNSYPAYMPVVNYYD